MRVPRVRPALVPDSGPNKRVCLVLDPPSGRQSNANPDAPVTGHWAVARPIGEPLAPIPEVIEPLETIEEMELDDTKPEPQPVLPIQTMQQHLHSFQIYLDERRAQDEADARLADFATRICDTTTDVNSSVSVSTKQTKSCLPSLCPAPILSVPRPLYSHSELQESALPNSQYAVSVGEPAHLLALWARLKSTQAGSTPTLQRDQTRPSCEFIHCSCHSCNVFRVQQGGWRDALCSQRVGCKCVNCQLWFYASGH